MILMIDNYDSFTYNLVQYLGELGKDIRIYRNDKITISKISSLKPSHIVISPGPGRPENAGISGSVIKNFTGKIPILGVCLGHQCIGYVFAGKIVQAKRLMHGKTSMIYHDGKTIFRDLPNPFEATRYHSLVIEKKSIPKCFEISAWTKDDEIMGVRYKKSQKSEKCTILEGVQFHPESILTVDGKHLLKNFLSL
jgi:para-aminobenzoate synthetase component II